MTKRLFAYLGLTMLSVYTVVFYFGFFGICAAALVAVIFVVCAFVKGFRANRRVLAFIAVVALASALLFSVYDSVYNSIGERFAGNNASVTAQVKSDGVKNGGVYDYELKAERINTENTNVRIILYSNYKLSCKYGDTIKFKARLKRIDNNYYRSRRFVYAAESDEFKLDYTVQKSGGSDAFHVASVVQSALSERIKSIVPESKGELCAAVGFGDRDGLSDDVNRMFSKTGLSFLIVVSGLHMSMVAMFLLFVLRPLGKRRRGNIIRFIIVALVIVFYMLITGLTASVVRSGIAVLLTSFAVTFRIRSDAFNSLGLAAFIIVALNPYAVGDVGMLLSFSSVAGKLYFFPILYRRFEDYYKTRKEEILLNIKASNIKSRIIALRLKYALVLIADAVIVSLLISLSAVMASMPVICLAIGYVNPATVVLSLFLTPLITCVVVLTLLIAIFCYVPIIGFLSYVFGAAANVVSEVILYLVRMIYSAKYMTLYLDTDTVWLWLGMLALLLGIVLLLKRNENTVFAAVILSIVFLAGISSAKYFVHSGSVTAKIISMSEPSVKITGKGVEALLSYNCDYDNLNGFISKNRSSCGDIRTLIVPDDSLRTSRIANAVLNEFDVESVMMYHSKRSAADTELKALSCNDYREFSTYDTVRVDLGQGITDTIINDGKSTWQYVRSNNTTLLIVPNKADANRLDESYRTADVIVCGTDIFNIDLLGNSGSVFVTGGSANDLNFKLG